MSRNLGSDCSITIYDGGPFSDSGPSWGSSLEVVAFAKSIDIDEDDETQDMHGMGDKRKKFRPTVGGDTLTIELMVERSYVATTRQGYGKVIFIPRDIGDAVTYTGIWSKTNKKASTDDPQTQTLTLLCDYDDA